MFSARSRPLSLLAVAVVAALAAGVPAVGGASPARHAEAVSSADTAPASHALAAKPKKKKTLRGWQINERRVGLAPKGLSCDSLPTYQGPEKPAAGTKIKRKLVTTPLDLSNGDIVVAKSCIRPTSTGYHNDFLVTTTTCADGCGPPAAAAS